MNSRAELLIRDLVEKIPRNPNYTSIPMRRSGPSMIVWHCDDAPNWDVWDVVKYDLRPNHISPRGCPVPTYAYWIGRTGRIYKIAQEAYVTWHAGVSRINRIRYRIPDWNAVSVAICFAHDPDSEPDLTPEQYESGHLLSAWMAVRRDIQSGNVKGHRELAVTGYDPKTGKLRKTCPGLGIDLDAVRRNVRDLKLRLLSGELHLEVKIVQ